MSGRSGWSERTRAQVVRVGFAAGNDWRARGVRLDKRRREVPGGWAESRALRASIGSSCWAATRCVNALFAMAIGMELGLSRAEVARGLAECQPPKMRLELWESGGVRVLDDAYNANADSMVAALQTLQELPCKGRRVAVLGDMAELGAHSEAAHEEVGRRAAELGVGQLFAVGKMAPVMARAARDAGLNRVFEFADVETAAAAVKSFVKTGDVVLLKASRATRLERIGRAVARRQKPSEKTKCSIT